MNEIKKVYKRFWWPHGYAVDRGLLWVKVVVGYRYFIDGQEVELKTALPVNEADETLKALRRQERKELMIGVIFLVVYGSLVWWLL